MTKPSGVSRAILYIGILLLAVGIIVSASAVWEVAFTQGLCQGGSSPQPVQGCGYIPELVMFHWGPNSQYPILLLGLYLTYAGAALLTLRWMASRLIQKMASPAPGRLTRKNNKKRDFPSETSDVQSIESP